MWDLKPRRESKTQVLGAEMEVWDLKSRCWELNSSCGSPNSQSQGGPGWALGPFHPKPFPHSLFPLDSRSDHAEGGQHHPPAERLQLGFGCSQLGKAGLGMGRELWKTGIAPEVKIPAFLGNWFFVVRGFLWEIKRFSQNLGMGFQSQGVGKNGRENFFRGVFPVGLGNPGSPGSWSFKFS